MFANVLKKSDFPQHSSVFLAIFMDARVVVSSEKGMRVERLKEGRKEGMMATGSFFIWRHDRKDVSLHADVRPVSSFGEKTN